MKNNSVKRLSSLAATAALVLGCAIMMVPQRTGAAEPAKEKRQVWTATEAEMARAVADGVPLKDIINSSVNTGAAIHDVVAGAIKIGVDPSLVVYTSINEGYDAQTVVKAALDAGVPIDVVLRSATNAGRNKKKYVAEIVAAAVKIGVDPSVVVHVAIIEGYPAQSVITAVLRAGAPLDVVVKSAIDAGTDKKAVYAGAADAGKPPVAVERSMSAAGTSVRTVDKSPEMTAEKAAISPSTQPEVAPPSRSLEPPPAIFGMGGVVLTRIPAGPMTSLLFPAGPLKINPFVGFSEAFTDNVFFTADNRKRDSITTITPGVRVKLPFQTHSAELEYYSVITRHGYKYRIEDTSDHHVSAAVDLNFGDRFGMQLSDSLARDHEPRSSSATGNIEVFHTNAAAVSAAYRTSELTRIQIDYTKSDWRYTTSPFRDREEGRITGSVFYRVLPGASLLIEYGHRNIAYSDDTLGLDSSVDTMQAGATWDISARSKGTIKAGLARKDFKSSARSAGTIKVGSADVRHDFTEDATIVLTAQRSMNEPDIPGSAYFISTGGFAEFTHRFVKEWAYVFRGAYVQDLNLSRTDRTTLGGIGLKYRAKDWLEFAIDYDRHKRQSNIQANDYTEQSSIITANISL